MDEASLIRVTGRNKFRKEGSYLSSQDEEFKPQMTKV